MRGFASDLCWLFHQPGMWTSTTHPDVLPHLGYKGWPEISVLLHLKSTSPLQISSHLCLSIFCIAAVKSAPFSEC